MGKLRALAAVLVVAAAPGCWLQAGLDAGRTAGNGGEATVTAASVAGLEVAWTTSVGGSAREAIVDGGTAYVRSPGTLTAIDVATGAVRWTAPSLPGSSTPAVVAGRLVVPTNGTPSCAAVTLDTATGVATATRAVDAPVTGRLWCVTSDALVVGQRLTVPVTELGGFVCAIFMGFPVPETISARGFVTLDYGPAPATDAVALSLFDSGCGTGNPGEPPPEQPLGTAVGTAGEILWPDRRPASGRVVSPAGCATPCDPTWSIPGADGDDPAGALASGAGDWVVVSSSTLSVIGGASHAVEWTGDLASVVHLAASGSILYAATSDGRVAAFPAGGCGAATCAPTWTATVGAGSSEISVGGDVLYVGGDDGTVSALPAHGCGAVTCAPLWSADLAAGVTGRPVIDRGTLLVPSSDGTVTAFRLPG